MREYEVPPTAGMPLRFADFLPARGEGDFLDTAKGMLGVSHAGLACSGTASLTLLLSALRLLVPQRRSVIVPAYTCPLVVLAVARCGLKVRLCDLAPGSLALDPCELARLCDEDTLAVLPTHLAGRVVELETSRRLAGEVGAWVIEDAAQAFGARLEGRSVGLVGDAGFFSFAVGKGLTLFEGGMWVTRHPELAAAIEDASRRLLPWRPSWELMRSLQLIGYGLCYRPSLLPWVYGRPLRRALQRGEVAEALGDVFSADFPLHRLGRWRQKVGARALRRWPAFRDALQAQAQERLPRLRALPGVTVFEDAPGGEGVWPLFFLQLPSEAAREEVLRRLWTAGLGVSRMFAHALPDYAYLRPWVEEAPVPVARALAARSLTISNSLWLDEGRFARTVHTLETVLAD